MTENSLYPGSFQIAPMRYAVKPSQSQIEQAWSSGDWIAQEKKDGAFYQLEKTDVGDIYMFGRTVSKKTGEYTEKSDNFPHIKKWAEDSLPNGTILIGEIYVPGGKSNDVTKISGCTPANAYKRQFESSEYQPVHYYVFDIIRFKGQDLCDMGTVDRLVRLEWGLDGLWDGEYVECAQTYYDNFEEHLKNIFAAGGEGMVFKHMDCPYRAGKRTTASQMFKYKESLDSVDLVCIGLEDPTYYYEGKEAESWPYKNEKGELITKPAYYGWKTALRVGAYKDGKIKEVGTVASGLTDADREDMGVNPENWIDKVVEIQCMSTTKDGALRHPVFRRVREDKGPDDCLWNEIFK
jgi:ATP-dependent DNA ligase